MTGYGSKFTRNKEKAIAALIRQPTMAAAAKEAGINTKTLQRWRRMPEFEEAYRQARRDNFSQLTAGFQQACPLALGTLLTIMTDGKAPQAIKVRAAICTVQYATQAVAQENLQARVQRLEQTQQEPASSVCAGPLPVETARRSPGKGHGSKFDRKKEEAIAALLTQPTMEGAARTAKISTKCNGGCRQRSSSKLMSRPAGTGLGN